MQELKEALRRACRTSFDVDIKPELTRPEEKFGDYSTNLALQLAKRLGKNPHEVAQQLIAGLNELPILAKKDIAGPGFINFTFTDEVIAKAARSAASLPKPLDGQEIVLEHTDPNPFKEFHVGHAYSNTIGVAIGKLLETAGAVVHQVSYHGDVGLHIAMAVWAIRKKIGGEKEISKAELNRLTQGSAIGEYYVLGARAYREDENAKREIEEVNSHLYSRDNDVISSIYDAGRDLTLEIFNKIYEKLGSHFEKQYFESDTAKEGIEVVKGNLGKIFEESDGAIVFKGEKVGLHTRVFITGKGLPTYEAKEIGLVFAKNRDYPSAQRFIVVTGNEIDEYFNVLVAAIGAIDPALADKIRHLSHGMVRFADGKMSSRTGNVQTFVSLQAALGAKVQELYGDDKNTPGTVLGAMKYEFLKHRVGSDFVFDIDESISLQGNSGPYLQYAYARARSILAKAGAGAQKSEVKSDFQHAERSLARKISEYPEVVQKATSELMPHHICTYLYELAQAFNSFYEGNRVIGDERLGLRLSLVRSYGDVLKNGLALLNIAAPESV